jgi:hypothetical protein
MTLGESPKSYECRKTSSYEEVEIVNRGGKTFWVCPHSDFELLLFKRKSRMQKGYKTNRSIVGLSIHVLIVGLAVPKKKKERCGRFRHLVLIEAIKD